MSAFHVEQNKNNVIDGIIIFPFLYVFYCYLEWMRLICEQMIESVYALTEYIRFKSI